MFAFPLALRLVVVLCLLLFGTCFYLRLRGLFGILGFCVVEFVGSLV